MKNLLHHPDARLAQDMAKALAAVKKAFAVPKGHMADLPFAVRDCLVCSLPSAVI